MGIRDTLKKSPAIGIVVASLLIALAAIRFAGGGSGESQGMIWYYDLQTAQRVAALPTADGSPVTLPSGNRGVVARVFSCGQCDDELFVGYIEERNPNPPPRDPELPLNRAAELYVARPHDAGAKPVWHRGDSPEGNEIMAVPQQRCGNHFRECLP